MTKAPKKPQAVIDAESAVQTKSAELKAAQEELARLGANLSAAHAVLRQARIDADASLPQCRMVNVRRDGAEEGGAAYVILRRTPGGLLVIRRAGGGQEQRFKWSGSAYQPAERDRGWSDRRELRDVPPAYMPATAEATLGA